MITLPFATPRAFREPLCRRAPPTALLHPATMREIMQWGRDELYPETIQEVLASDRRITIFGMNVGVSPLGARLPSPTTRAILVDHLRAVEERSMQ